MLFNIFKRKQNRQKDIKIPTREEILEKAKDKARVNGLSPEQIEKLIQNNVDVDFLPDEISQMMKTPDINYWRQKWMPSNTKTNRSHILPEDVVKATILGDIIGSKFEFAEHDYEDTRTMELLDKRNFYTDDTVLSLATEAAILKNPEEPNFAEAYKKAYHQYPRAGYGSGFVGWALNWGEGTNNDNAESQCTGYGSFANGSAMRVSFIPAYYKNVQDVIDYAIKSANVTHNHIDGIKGAVVISVCIWLALNGYSKEEIHKYCKSHYGYTADEKELLIYSATYFDMNIQMKEQTKEDSQTSIYCNFAVPFAVQCFYETNSYQECMRKILSCFCDSDTICAIAGGLCYAFYGTTEMDVESALISYNVPTDLLD